MPEDLCKMRIKSEKVVVTSESTKCDQNNNEFTNNFNNDYLKTHQENKTNIARKLLSIIRKGDFDELVLLLSTKPDLNVFINGQTALHHCLLLGRDVSWCQQLVNNGANPNLSNQDGWHPIHLAAFNGLHESLTYLITCNSKEYDE